MKSLPLIPTNGGQLFITGAKLKPGLTREQWASMWPSLRAINGAINFVLGDWVNYALDNFKSNEKNENGEEKEIKFSELVKATETEYFTLSGAAWVCRSVPFCLRRQNLTWSHHKEVASITNRKDQIKYLDLAEKNEWSVSELRQRIREDQSTEDEEVCEQQSTVGFIPRVWVLEGVRSLRNAKVEAWPREKKAALREELKPIVELYNQL